MVEPSFLALTTTPSMTGSAAELTLPASAAADWASAGTARPNWNRTAAVAALEASNAFRIRMAFPSGLDLLNSNASPTKPGKIVTFLRQPRPAGPLLQGGSGAVARMERLRNAGAVIPDYASAPSGLQTTTPQSSG